jgi:hypothetical protein
MLKTWLHGLYVAILPFALAAISPYILHLQLPAGTAWTAVACAIIVPMLGYVSKIGWLGTSATFSWAHIWAVTGITAAIQAALPILGAGHFPTEAQWIIIGQTAIGALIGYVAKFYHIGSSGGDAVPANQ